MTQGPGTLDGATLEPRLAALPGVPPGLDPGAALQYTRRRRRISRHHGTWRAGMPALDELFDDDAHRARALAGNLGTELRDSLELGASLVREAGLEQSVADEWVRVSIADWRSVVGQALQLQRWDPAVAGVFEGFLEELCQRARQAAEAAYLGPPVAARPPGWALGLRRALLVARRGVGRVFRP